MNENASFYRKIAYLCAIAALLFPLYLLGAPASYLSDKGGQRLQFVSGGLLVSQREQAGLSRANLGQIDPASETMKLATLGFRGFAVSLLWEQANEYKKKKDWDKFIATVQQLKFLQPNFVNFWEFQSHNVSYNTSVEFEDYHLRYHWVKKGLNLLMDGTRYNRDDTKLQWYVGWMFGQKLGRSDESRQFRRLFRLDGDWHADIRNYLLDDMDQATGPDGQHPDNWLVGRLWFIRAQDAHDYHGRPIRGNGPVVFYSNAPMSLINYSDAIQNEGYIGETSQLAWRRAGRDWYGELDAEKKGRVSDDAHNRPPFGERPILTSYGYNIQLNHREALLEQADKLRKDLDALAGDIRGEITAEKKTKLSEETRTALDTPAKQRSPAQQQLAAAAEGELKVTDDEVVQRAKLSGDVLLKARRLARQILMLTTYAQTTERYREVVNFNHWKTRCQAEQMTEAIDARVAILEADKRLAEGQFVASAGKNSRLGARENFERGFDKWAVVYDRFPDLYESIEADDLFDKIKIYRDKLLQDSGEDLPADFKLHKIVERFKHKLSSPKTTPTTKPKPADKKPAP